MVPKVKLWWYCFWNGHTWDKHRGYENMPKDGAVCLKCDKQYLRDGKDYL